LIPSLSRTRLTSPRLFLIVAPLTLVIGLLCALLVAELTMSPPGEELLSLAAYLSLTGALAVLVGWLLAGSRGVWRFGLRGKTFLGSMTGGFLGLLNTFLIARLMFVSTSHDLWVLAAAISFSVAVMTVFGLMVAASVAERVDLIGAAVRSLAGEEGQPHPARPATDEVARLARDVERLSAKLRAADLERARVEAERRDLTAAVSHDLRTPVASVRAMAEALAAGVLESEADERNYVELIQREADRLSRMIDDLFDLAQLDAGALRLDQRYLPLEEIVADVLEGMQPQAREKGVRLALGIVEPGIPDVFVDGGCIERVVANLLRNAIEHTPHGGLVEVCLRREPSWVVLTVSDSGEGLDEEHLKEIWQRFYRADKSRPRQRAGGDGAGLGLSIVRGFVEAHAGTVEAASKPGGGAAFTVRLPPSP